jgi:molybdenum cofactor synthesis domain-containing protein
MSEQGEVASVNISRTKGTPKEPVAEILVDERGVVGDAHAGPWHRQVSLLGLESLDRFAKRTGRTVRPGEFAENLTLRGIDVPKAAVLDRFSAGTVLLEVTQIGKACHGQGCAIFQAVGECAMPKEGIFCRVLRGGHIRVGVPIVHEPKVLRCLTITLSDRASRGEYSDRSGPRAHELLKELGATLPWPVQTDSLLLPDDAERLRAELLVARDHGVDLVFTLGSTGAGPRDIAPETVAGVCEKQIPGIMEAIRAKYGAQNPRALLSRGIVGLAGRTLVYTLPGSVKAVEEYTAEIGQTLKHLVLMVQGIDAH